MTDLFDFDYTDEPPPGADGFWDLTTSEYEVVFEDGTNEDVSRIVTLDLSVELPHPDAGVSVIYRMHDGSWKVTLIDRHGIGTDRTVTGTGPDALSASRSTHERLLAVIAARREREAARALARPVGGRLPAPEGRVASGGKTAALGPRRGRPPESQTVQRGPYTGSVPRNAASLVVTDDGFEVTLKSGLVWSDTRTSEVRTFQTSRLMKDHTRGAVSS